MLEKIRISLNKIDKNKVNKGLIFVLLIYLFFGMLAYKLIPVNSIYSFFRTAGPGGVAVRALSTGIICIYSLLVCVVNKKKFPFVWFFVFVVILLMILVSTLCTQHEYAYAFEEPFFSTLNYRYTAVGLNTLLKMYLSTVSDFAIGFCFVFLLPYAFHDKKTILIYIYVMCFIMLYEVIYSIFNDAEQYKKLLSGITSPYLGTDLQIRGGFSDKEDFGAFLTMGCSLSLLGFTIHSKEQKLYVLRQIFVSFCALVFMVFSIASLCKTAAIACVICIFVFLIILILKSFKKSKRFGIIVSLFVGLLFVAIICFYSIAELHSNGFLQKIYNFTKNYIIDRIVYSVTDRDGIWMAFMSKINGANFFFGYGKGGIDAYYYSINPTSDVSIHNGIIYFLGSNGLISLILFICIFIIVFKNILLVYKIDKTVMLALIAAICCAFIFSLSERDMVILSSSTKAFSYCVIIALFPLGLQQLCKSEESYEIN